MKKIMMALLMVSSLALTGCNMNIGIGNYHFTKAHLVHANKCVEITSWHDNSTGIEIRMTDGNTLFCSEGTYILIEDYCPICGK